MLVTCEVASAILGGAPDPTSHTSRNVMPRMNITCTRMPNNIHSLRSHAEHRWCRLRSSVNLRLGGHEELYVAGSILYHHCFVAKWRLLTTLTS